MITWSVVALAVAAGYAAGSVSPATLVARRYGLDLRAGGSGNPGATNVGRVVGRRAGVLVAVLDVSKGLLPAYLFGLWSHPAGLVAGVAAVLGHVTSPWLHGRGGRGVATAGGALLGSHPLWAPVVLVVWVVVAGATRWVALASVAAAFALAALPMVTGAPVADATWAAVLALVVAARHWANFHRWWVDRRPQK